MKITILQGAFLPVPPIQGGAVEKRWYRMGQEFAKEGHNVYHISKRHKNLPSVEDKFGVRYIRSSGFRTPKSGILLKLKDLVYTLVAIRSIPNDSDIVITNTFWAPLFISKKLKHKVLVDVARMPKGQLKLYKGVGLLRANSSPVLSAVIDEVRGTLLETKTVCIPNPLPFVPSRPVNFSRKSKTILFTGRIHPEKGIHLLIEAFSNLKSDWELIIVGPWDVASGGGGVEYLNELKSIAKSVVSQIRFTGPIFDIDVLNDYYYSASIFVYPSIAEKGETFGLAPLEAMAWGCCTIVSDLMCFKDFIKNDVNGFVFDHRSVDPVLGLQTILEYVISKKDLRETISLSATEVRNTHSVSKISKQFLAVFESLM